MKACFCLPLNHAVKMVAVVCIVAGIIVASISSWVLHGSMQAEKNPTKKTAEDLLLQVNQFFGGTTGLYDLDVIFRILIYCSAAALVGGFLQFLMSFWLLMASVRGGRKMALIWVIIHVLIMIAIGGSFLCILTNELQITPALQVFLPITAIDSLLLIYFCWVVYAFSQLGGDEDSLGRRRDIRVTPRGNVPVSGKDEQLRTPRRTSKARTPLMETDF